MPVNNRTPVPPGSFVEVDPTLLDEGRFLKTIGVSIKKALAELLEYEQQTGDLKAASQITLKVKLGRTEGTSNHFDVQYAVEVKSPAVTRGSIMLERDGRLLCQPTGASDADPEQMVLFDAQGRAIGDIDPTTGEVRRRPAGDVPPVAGRIGNGTTTGNPRRAGYRQVFNRGGG
jgi:hypothetical protein